MIDTIVYVFNVLFAVLLFEIVKYVVQEILRQRRHKRFRDRLAILPRPYTPGVLKESVCEDNLKKFFMETSSPMLTIVKPEPVRFEIRSQLYGDFIFTSEELRDSEIPEYELWKEIRAIGHRAGIPLIIEQVPTLDGVHIRWYPDPEHI